MGFRLFTLPDPSVAQDDPDFAESIKDLTQRMVHLTKCLQRFWKRWKREYLMELREFYRTQLDKGLTYTLNKGEVVTIYDEGHPWGIWRLGRTEDFIEGTDGKVRGVIIRVVSKKGRVQLLRRPIQHIYPLEIHSTSPFANPRGLQLW